MVDVKAITSDIEKELALLGDLSKGVKYDDIKIRFAQVFGCPGDNQFDFTQGAFCGTIVRGADGTAILTDLSLNGQLHLI